MKQVWKRVLSLALSGVLLLGSLPLGALATEETTAPATETQPIDTQPAAETVTLQHSAEVANEGGGNPDETPVTPSPALYIDNEQYENGQLQNVSFDPAQNILTLSGTEIHNIEARNMSLTIELIGMNHINAISGNAIKTDRDLTITGDGFLVVDAMEPVAVLVGGVSAAGDSDQKGLTFDSVCVEIETTHNSDQQETEGVVSPNGVVIKGESHIRISHSRASDSYVMKCDGYLNAETYTANSPVNGGEALEFIAKEHLGDVVTKTDKDNKRYHCRSCKDDSCMGAEIGKHEIDEKEKYATAGASGHRAVFACCGAVKETEVKPHVLNYEAAGATITARCTAPGCTAEGTATLTADGGEWQEGKSYGAAVSEATGVLEDVDYTDADIKYYLVNADGSLGEEAQNTGEPGNYRAILTMSENCKPYADFTVNKKALTDAMIEKIPDKVYYPDGVNRTEPEVKVTDPDILVEGQPKVLTKEEHYSVKFYRGEQPANGDYTTPGKITVVVEALASSKYYTGSAKTEYIINKAEVTAKIEPVLPTSGNHPVYDGTEKSLSVTVSEIPEAENIATPVAEFYETPESTAPVRAINAGTYIVKVRVPENAYYAEKVLEGEPAWELVIDPTDAYDLDPDMKTQMICVGDNGFVNPKVLGVEKDGAKEEVTGRFTYTFGETTYSSESAEQMAALNTELRKQENKEVEVAYVFTPTNPNYKDSINGKIKVKVVKIAFEVDGKAVGSENRAYTVKTNPQPVYLDTDIVTLKTITAKVGESTTTSGFTVLFQKAGGEEKAVPDAGTNSFKVYFSGTLDGVSYDKVVVDSGSVEIARKTPAVTVTAAANLTDRNAGDPLVTVTSNGEKIKFSINGGTTWSYDIPVVPAEHGSGVYTVRYEVEGTTNFTAKSGYDPVKVVVTPYLTAAYGTTLAQVQEQIECASGTWAFEEPGATKVGAVNTAGNVHNMSFTPTGATQATKTNCPVKVYVSAAHITLEFDVAKRHHAYTSGNEIKASVTVKEKANSNTREATLLDPFPDTEYNLTYSNNKNPGKATVTISSKGNYIFDNSAEELTKEFVIYRLGILKLKDDASAVPPELKDNTGKKYETGADIKEALSEKYDEKTYPANRRTYVKYLMMNEGTAPRYDEFYWPDGGSGTIKWEYDNIVTKDDNFKIYGMYMVTSERLDTEAGEIFEMKRITSGTPGVNEFYVGADGIQFKLQNYAVLCFAAEANPDVEYTITKAVSPSSSYGTVSVKADSKAVSKAKYGTKLTITATPKSGYSLTSVTVTDANSNTVSSTKVSEGNYELTMPASNIKVTAKFAKTSSSTKNPYSGDTSNIYLWLTVLAASAVGIVALVIILIKKRRK